MSCRYSFPSHVKLSKDCLNLISRIFVINPAQRIKIAGIKAHPWFIKNLPKEVLEIVYPFLIY